MSRGPARALVTWLRGSDLPALALLALLSVAPLAWIVLQEVPSGGRWTGADGIFPSDQLLYLASIRDAGEHWLVSNQFRLDAPRHDFLHPVHFLSGLAWRAGLSVQLAYLLWKPVAVAVLFLGFRAYVRRSLGPDGWAPRVALIVALLYFTPAFLLLKQTGIASGDNAYRLQLIAYEGFPPYMLWGYLHAAVAMGLLPLTLLAVERLLVPERRAPGRTARWYAGWASAGALAMSWAHAWQGEIFLLILGGLALWGRLERRYLALAAPALAALLPLLYLVVLARADPVWELARDQANFPRAGVLSVAVALAPLGALALLTVRGAGDDVHERGLRLWPLAALAVYFPLAPTFAYHAFQGLSLPLAILAVRGWGRLRMSARLRPFLAAAAVAVVTVPGIAHAANFFHNSFDDRAGGYALTADEARALDDLEAAPGEGGVLAREDFGAAVPAFTGRASWAGHPTWTPDFSDRERAASDLLAGRVPGPAAQALVSDTGARFVFADCGARADLAALLGTGAAAHPVGCAAVYDLRAIPRASP